MEIFPEVVGCVVVFNEVVVGVVVFRNEAACQAVFSAPGLCTDTALANAALSIFVLGIVL